jgi:hypothetical protein
VVLLRIAPGLVCGPLIVVLRWPLGLARGGGVVVVVLGRAILWRGGTLTLLWLRGRILIALRLGLRVWTILRVLRGAALLVLLLRRTRLGRAIVVLL